MNPLSITADLWRHRGILAQFALRSIELRHKGSILGFGWALARPLLILGLYLAVFGWIFNGHFGVLPGETRTDYALGIFTGLVFFNLLAEVIAVGPTLIVTQPNFVKKVVFPLQVLPAASVAAAVFHFAVSLTIAVAGAALFGPGLTRGILWLPVIALPVILLALGTAWAVAAVGVFVRDLGQASEFLVTVLMFLSAVVYSPARIPHPLWVLLRYNPLLHAIDLARDALLWGLPVSLPHLAYLYGSGIAAFTAGHAVFSRLRPAFADAL